MERWVHTRRQGRTTRVLDLGHLSFGQETMQAGTDRRPHPNDRPIPAPLPPGGRPLGQGDLHVEGRSVVEDARQAEMTMDRVFFQQIHPVFPPHPRGDEFSDEICCCWLSSVLVFDDNTPTPRTQLIQYEPVMTDLEGPQELIRWI